MLVRVRPLQQSHCNPDTFGFSPIDGIRCNAGREIEMSTHKGHPLLVFLFAGMLILLVAWLLWTYSGASETQKFLAQIVLNVGLILVAVFLSAGFWKLLGGDPIGTYLMHLQGAFSGLQKSVLLLEDSRITGLQRLHSTSGALALNREWMPRLRRAEKKLDLMGYSLIIWTRGIDFEKGITRLVGNGVKVRILIMSTSNESLGVLVNNQVNPKSLAVVKANIEAAHEVFSGLSSTLGSKENPNGGQYEFKVLKKGLIVTDLCRTDSEIAAAHYLYSVVASVSPLLEVKGRESDLFKVYKGEFESLWELGVHP